MAKENNANTTAAGKHAHRFLKGVISYLYVSKMEHLACTALWGWLELFKSKTTEARYKIRCNRQTTGSSNKLLEVLMYCTTSAGCRVERAMHNYVQHRAFHSFAI
jgi:hypothetical protein